MTYYTPACHAQYTGQALFDLAVQDHDHNHNEATHRTAYELRELSRYSIPHQHLNEIAHLRRRIGTLLVHTNPL